MKSEKMQGRKLIRLPLYDRMTWRRARQGFPGRYNNERTHNWLSGHKKGRGLNQEKQVEKYWMPGELHRHG